MAESSPIPTKSSSDQSLNTNNFDRSIIKYDEGRLIDIIACINEEQTSGEAEKLYERKDLEHKHMIYSLVEQKSAVRHYQFIGQRKKNYQPKNLETVHHIFDIYKPTIYAADNSFRPDYVSKDPCELFVFNVSDISRKRGWDIDYELNDNVLTIKSATKHARLPRRRKSKQNISSFLDFNAVINKPKEMSDTPPEIQCTEPTKAPRFFQDLGNDNPKIEFTFNEAVKETVTLESNRKKFRDIECIEHMGDDLQRYTQEEIQMDPNEINKNVETAMLYYFRKMRTRWVNDLTTAMPDVFKSKKMGKNYVDKWLERYYKNRKPQPTNDDGNLHQAPINTDNNMEELTEDLDNKLNLNNNEDEALLDAQNDELLEEFPMC